MRSRAGSLPAETQGASFPNGDEIPIDHIVVVMMENRSFDHYFQKLPEYGQPDVEVAPADYANLDSEGNPVAPFHSTELCFVDTDHEWEGSHVEWADGLMNGFVVANEGAGTAPPHPTPTSMRGTRAIGYYDETDIPFYYWLANEFSIADHYFCSLLGPTFPNRQYLYAASSRGSTGSAVPSFDDRAFACEDDAACGGEPGSCSGGACKGTCSRDEDCGRDAPIGACQLPDGVCSPVGRTIFDYLDQRKIDFKIYSAGTPGWLLTLEAFSRFNVEHQRTMDDYYADAAAGTLPQVAFIDPHIADEAYDQDDEHPPAIMQFGELFVANVTDALEKSPNWSSAALFFTYDEHGGLFDHMPPPEACPPGDFPANVAEGDPPGDFDRYGVRVPMIVVSPFAKPHYVSHEVYDHTSILRFIEARFVLPAITARDANALAPWDMFDFSAPAFADPPAVPIPEVDAAAVTTCAAIWEP